MNGAEQEAELIPMRISNPDITKAIPITNHMESLQDHQAQAATRKENTAHPTMTDIFTGIGRVKREEIPATGISVIIITKH